MLNPDNLEIVVICAQPHCSTPLWKMRMLKRDGEKPVSTEWTPLLPGVAKFPDQQEYCPVCDQGYWVEGPKGERSFRIIDPVTGQRETI